MENFDLIVEGVTTDPLKVTPPTLHLVRLSWHNDSPPDVIILSPKTILVKSGKYLTKENKYQYRIASIGKIVDGNLVEVK